MKAPKREKKIESLLFAFWQIPMVKHIGLGHTEEFLAAASNIITCVCFGRWIFVHESCNYLRIRTQEDLVGII
jgi:hypothetical protein